MLDCDPNGRTNGTRLSTALVLSHALIGGAN
jgi:hypothetical protein